jgi:hypothetical protein
MQDDPAGNMCIAEDHKDDVAVGLAADCAHD